MIMRRRLNFRAIFGALAALSLLVIADVSLHQSDGESIGSVTVELPPAHSLPSPGFKN
jgi:hypothetical protein